MTPTPSTSPDRLSFARWHRGALSLVVACLAIEAALGSLWVRSVYVTDTFSLARVDPSALRTATLSSSRGSAALVVSLYPYPPSPTTPAPASAGGGFWRFRHDGDRSGRPLVVWRCALLGPLRTLCWSKDDHPAGGWVRVFAAPYWLAASPFVVPPVWWLWCRPGRALPTLTLARLALVVAASAVAFYFVGVLWRLS